MHPCHSSQHREGVRGIGHLVVCLSRQCIIYCITYRLCNKWHLQRYMSNDRWSYCLGVIVCFINVSGVARLQKVFEFGSFSCQLTLALLKSIEWLLCQAWATIILEPLLFYIFLRFECLPFFSLKTPSSLTNVAPTTIGARDFIHHIGLKFNERPKLGGREFLLQGLVRSSHNCNSVLSRTTCEGFCDTTNMMKASHSGWFISIRLKNMPTNSSGEGISSGKDFHF